MKAQVSVLAVIVSACAILLAIKGEKELPGPVVVSAPAMPVLDLPHKQHRLLECIPEPDARSQKNSARTWSEIEPPAAARNEPTPAATMHAGTMGPPPGWTTVEEYVAEGCGLDAKILAELADQSPEIRAAMERSRALFEDGTAIVAGYFGRECMRLRDGLPSIPLSVELLALIDPLPGEMCVAAESADLCIRRHVLEQNLSEEKFIWIEETGGCDEELRWSIYRMARKTMEQALQEHGGL